MSIYIRTEKMSDGMYHVILVVEIDFFTVPLGVFDTLQEAKEFMDELMIVKQYPYAKYDF